MESQVDDSTKTELNALEVHDVPEISPPGFTEKCKAFGLLPGYAVDLQTGCDLMDKT